MADKELRRMNRTELIEIIYALQQNEQKLQKENDRLTAELDDRKIRLDKSGSIAEAALSLNHIFEDAQAAADQYLLSLQSRDDQRTEPDLSESDQTEPESAAEESESDAGVSDGMSGSEVKADADKAGSGPEEVPKNAGREGDRIVEDARQQAREILDDARRKSDNLLASAHKLAETEAEETRQQCEKERRAVKEYHDKFLQDMSDILKENPELLEKIRQMGTVEGA